MANGTPGSKGGFLEGFLGGTIEGFEEVSRRNREDTQKAIDQQTEQIKAIQKSMIEDPDSPYDSKFLLETVKGLYDLSQGPKKAKGPSLKWEAPITYIDKLMSGEIPVGNLHEALQFANEVGGKVPKGKSTNPYGVALAKGIQDLNQNGIDDREEGSGQSSLPENMGGTIQEPGPEDASSSRSLPQSVSPSVREGDEPPLSIRHPDSPTTTTSGQPVPLGPVGPTRPRQQVEVPEVPVPPLTNNDASRRVGEAATAARDALNQVEMGDMPPATPPLETMVEGTRGLPAYEPSGYFFRPHAERAAAGAISRMSSLPYEAAELNRRAELIDDPQTLRAADLARQGLAAASQQFYDIKAEREAEDGPMSPGDIRMLQSSLGIPVPGQSTTVGQVETWIDPTGEGPPIEIRRLPEGRVIHAESGDPAMVPRHYELAHTEESRVADIRAQRGQKPEGTLGYDENGNRLIQSMTENYDGTIDVSYTLAPGGMGSRGPSGLNIDPRTGELSPWGSFNTSTTPPPTSDAAPITEDAAYNIITRPDGIREQIDAELEANETNVSGLMNSMGLAEDDDRNRLLDLQQAETTGRFLPRLLAMRDRGEFLNRPVFSNILGEAETLMGGERRVPWNIGLLQALDTAQLSAYHTDNKELIDALLKVGDQIDTIGPARRLGGQVRSGVSSIGDGADTGVQEPSILSAFDDWQGDYPNKLPSEGLLENQLDQLAKTQPTVYSDILRVLGFEPNSNASTAAMAKVILEEMRKDKTTFDKVKRAVTLLANPLR